MQIEVVDHRANANPVDDVAQRATDQTDIGYALDRTAYAAPQQPGEHDTDGHAQHGQRMALPSAGIGQERKRSARVENMDQIEPLGDRDARAQRQILRDDPLDALVERQH